MKKLILFALAGIAVGGLGCARNPVTGKRQIVLVSESEEITMGRQSDTQVRQEYGIAEKQSLQDYTDGFIEYRNQILQIVGTTSDFHRFGGILEESIRSFNAISDKRILEVQPDRLKIYAAQQGDTLTALARSRSNPRATADDLAVLNRMAIDQPITPGRLLKIVEKGY
jgi:predicted Zn-dependent protease